MWFYIINTTATADDGERAATEKTANGPYDTEEDARTALAHCVDVQPRRVQVTGFFIVNGDLDEVLDARDMGECDTVLDAGGAQYL